MPQAIQPGGYSAMFRQQLLQTLLLQTAQMLGGQRPLLGGVQPFRNPALMATIDTALSSTVTSIDTQLAGVGIGVTSGLTPAPVAPGVQNRGPTGALIPQGQVAPNALALPANVGQPAARPPVAVPNVLQAQRDIGLA